MSKRNNSVLLIVILYLLLMGIFSGTRPEIQEFVFFAMLSALVIASSFLIHRHYLKDKNSLKHRLIYIGICFVKIMIFSVAVKELTGVALDHSILALFFIALSIFTLWELLDFSLWEKGVLVLVLITIIGIRGYESAEPSTAYQLYRSELSNVANHEKILDLLVKDYRNDFTPEDFQCLEPYLDPLQEQRFLRFSQLTFLEFEDGQMVMMEVSREDSDNKLRFNNIELLPEEVGSYFRYYPLEIERKADYPQNIIEEDKEFIIETKGAFISHASLYQKMEWYDKLIEVFGEKKAWDEMQYKLEGLHAPEGPMQGMGISDKGYLHFSFCTEWKVDKEVLNEIYIEFRDYAAKNDIPELPVLFKLAD
ncbi:hypothetical protein SYNTR_0193 [Candidatus Syntrophocurvum alkaliphilum]|uniref:Uncharacterized protein n=1 Tax=Candidatus Syntrophocurvum alkaliphilum TaxID=2293317 RepID=A0A6I6D625_9FIRM|nr:hypothetical protein [Candidatus Syntrophocurvum alkaliphilum]QGT98786.1 hypothetical protein SYNTR_0193 [Candidatus Syntrophocurvum alkaliphilum]